MCVQALNVSYAMKNARFPVVACNKEGFGELTGLGFYTFDSGGECRAVIVGKGEVITVLGNGSTSINSIDSELRL